MLGLSLRFFFGSDGGGSEMACSEGMRIFDVLSFLFLRFFRC